jgi:hypothetical protein
LRHFRSAFPEPLQAERRLRVGFLPKTLPRLMKALRCAQTHAAMNISLCLFTVEQILLC